MKAPAFEYIRPQSLSEAIRLLANAGGEARVIAGGQSLLAMMNLRLTAPELLIDIARLPELSVATEDDDWVTLGAGVTHAAIEDGRVPDPSQGLMARVAARLAYRAIRTRGTIGGSLALADPAAEWPAVLAALDAQAMVRGVGGRRALDCGGFATGIYQTELSEDEVIESVRIRKLSSDARWGFVKLSRKSGEFAEALAVAVADRARGHCRVVLGAVNGPPLMLAETSGWLAEDARGRETLRRVVLADLDRAADRHFDDFHHNLHLVAAVRAVQQATE